MEDASEKGELLMIWEHVDCTYAFFNLLLPLLAGAALGAGKQVTQQGRANKERALAAEQIRLSPYTGRKEFQQIHDPNAFENLGSGLSSGLQAADQFGAFKSDTNPAGAVIDNYDPETAYAPGSTSAGPWAPKDNVTRPFGMMMNQKKRMF